MKKTISLLSILLSVSLSILLLVAASFTPKPNANEPTYTLHVTDEYDVRIIQTSNNNYVDTTIDSVSYYLELNTH